MVRFYLHPTFRRRIRESHVDATGQAVIDLVAWGAFTLGAVVKLKDNEVRLELDLAQDVPDAPAAFKLR